jgi:hypothetical protein
MGEARKRGTYDQRRKLAVRRNKDLLIEKMGGRDHAEDQWLRTALEAFLAQLSPEDWKARKAALVERMKAVTKTRPKRVELSSAPSIRDREDEIVWYLFLCELALDDPMCMDVNQAGRALPFFAGIGERWGYSDKVQGLDQKVRETLKEGRKDPDGHLFEILVALSYAAKGWQVELIPPSPPRKTPDMVARKGPNTLYVECKRQSRTATYAEKERNDFLKLWHPCFDVLATNRQWIWINAVFHREVEAFEGDFLAKLLKDSLPLPPGEHVLLDNIRTASISARTIDRAAVAAHLRRFRVKNNSPMLTQLLGGDWAQMDSATTAAYLAKRSHVMECEVPEFGSYIDEISWASGITRQFDSDASIEKKARDVRNLLADAVKQVPHDHPSVIHIAAETMEGQAVERRRTEKILKSLPAFLMDKPVLGVRLHLFQAHQVVDKLYEFDETVEKFQADGVDLSDIPSRVVIPNSLPMVSGRHWEIYGPQNSN